MADAQAPGPAPLEHIGALSRPLSCAHACELGGRLYGLRTGGGSLELVEVQLGERLAERVAFRRDFALLRAPLPDSGEDPRALSVCALAAGVFVWYQGPGGGVSALLLNQIPETRFSAAASQLFHRWEAVPLRVVNSRDYYYEPGCRLFYLGGRDVLVFSNAGFNLWRLTLRGGSVEVAGYSNAVVKGTRCGPMCFRAGVAPFSEDTFAMVGGNRYSLAEPCNKVTLVNSARMRARAFNIPFFPSYGIRDCGVAAVPPPPPPSGRDSRRHPTAVSALSALALPALLVVAGGCGYGSRDRGEDAEMHLLDTLYVYDFQRQVWTGLDGWAAAGLGTGGAAGLRGARESRGARGGRGTDDAEGDDEAEDDDEDDEDGIRALRFTTHGAVFTDPGAGGAPFAPSVPSAGISAHSAGAGISAAGISTAGISTAGGISAEGISAEGISAADLASLASLTSVAITTADLVTRSPELYPASSNTIPGATPPGTATPEPAMSDFAIPEFTNARAGPEASEDGFSVISTRAPPGPSALSTLSTLPSFSFSVGSPAPSDSPFFTASVAYPGLAISSDSPASPATPATPGTPGHSASPGPPRPEPRSRSTSPPASPRGVDPHIWFSPRAMPCLVVSGGFLYIVGGTGPGAEECYRMPTEALGSLPELPKACLHPKTEQIVSDQVRQRNTGAYTVSRSSLVSSTDSWAEQARILSTAACMTRPRNAEPGAPGRAREAARSFARRVAPPAVRGSWSGAPQPSRLPGAPGSFSPSRATSTPATIQVCLPPPHPATDPSQGASYGASGASSRDTPSSAGLYPPEEAGEPQTEGAGPPPPGSRPLQPGADPAREFQAFQFSPPPPVAPAVPLAPAAPESLVHIFGLRSSWPQCAGDSPRSPRSPRGARASRPARFPRGPLVGLWGSLGVGIELSESLLAATQTVTSPSAGDADWGPGRQAITIGGLVIPPGGTTQCGAASDQGVPGGPPGLGCGPGPERASD